jgi:hypothetical protein
LRLHVLAELGQLGMAREPALLDVEIAHPRQVLLHVAQVSPDLAPRLLARDVEHGLKAELKPPACHATVVDVGFGQVVARFVKLMQQLLTPSPHGQTQRRPGRVSKIGLRFALGGSGGVELFKSFHRAQFALPQRVYLSARAVTPFTIPYVWAPHAKLEIASRSSEDRSKSKQARSSRM